MEWLLGFRAGVDAPLDGGGAQGEGEAGEAVWPGTRRRQARALTSQTEIGRRVPVEIAATLASACRNAWA